MSTSDRMYVAAWGTLFIWFLEENVISALLFLLALTLYIIAVVIERKAKS